MKEYDSKLKDQQRGVQLSAVNRSQSPRPPLPASAELKTLSMAKPNLNFPGNLSRNDSTALGRVASEGIPAEGAVANNPNPTILHDIRETGKSASAMSISSQKQMRSYQKSPTRLNQMNQEMSGNYLEPAYL